MRRLLPLLAFPFVAGAQTPDWPKINAEALRHYTAAIQMDTTDPPGNETKLVEYVKKVLEAEGIPVITSAKDPARSNLIARIKGNGSKKPLLIMGHTDTVKVDPAKWKFGPFSAARDGGYVYGRGTVDDKDNLTAGLMTMLLLKRLKIPLDRDVIFVAEGGNVNRRDGQVRYALIQTVEKLPRGVQLVAHGVAGHGSRPLRSNPILHLSRAVEKIAMWDPPMRFNDTTRYYFEKLAGVSSPADAERYKGLFDAAKAPAVREYLAEHDPVSYSM